MEVDTHRRLTTTAVVGSVALLLLVAVWVASAGPTLDWSPNDGTGDPAPAQTQSAEQTPLEQRCADSDCERSDGDSLDALMVGFFVVAGVLLLVVIIALFRSRATLRPRRLRPSSLAPPGEALPDVAEAVRDDAEHQYVALRTDAPRNAIVACWVRLEDAVLSAGLTIRGSETSSELTQRVLATYVVDDSAITNLASLYREARFSRHEITEDMRGEAIDALGRLHESLATPAASGSEPR